MKSKKFDPSATECFGQNLWKNTFLNAAFYEKCYPFRQRMCSQHMQSNLYAKVHFFLLQHRVDLDASDAVDWESEQWVYLEYFACYEHHAVIGCKPEQKAEITTQSQRNRTACSKNVSVSIQTSTVGKLLCHLSVANTSATHTCAWWYWILGVSGFRFHSEKHSNSASPCLSVWSKQKLLHMENNDAFEWNENTLSEMLAYACVLVRVRFIRREWKREKNEF